MSLRIARSSLRPAVQAFRAPLASRWNATAASESAAPELTEGEQHIINKLTAKFQPSRLQVQDVSGGCGTFYAISITSPAFAGLTTLKQHRLVTAHLKDEVANIHGLQLKTIPE